MQSVALLLPLLWAAGALADDFTIATSGQLTQCEPVTISWTGGTAPYKLEVYPGGTTSATALAVLVAAGTEHSYTWMVNMPPSLTIWFRISEAGGGVVFSENLTILPGTTAVCPTTTSSSSASSSSGTLSSGSSTISSGSSDGSTSTTGSVSPSPTNSSGGGGVGGIAGGVAGGVVGGIIITIIIAWLFFSRRRRKLRDRARMHQADADQRIFEQDDSGDMMPQPYNLQGNTHHSRRTMSDGIPLINTNHRLETTIDGPIDLSIAAPPASRPPRQRHISASTDLSRLALEPLSMGNADPNVGRALTVANTNMSPMTAADEKRQLAMAANGVAIPSRPSNNQLVIMNDENDNPSSVPAEYAEDAEDAGMPVSPMVFPPRYNPRWAGPGSEAGVVPGAGVGGGVPIPAGGGDLPFPNPPNPNNASPGLAASTGAAPSAGPGSTFGATQSQQGSAPSTPAYTPTSLTRPPAQGSQHGSAPPTPAYTPAAFTRPDGASTHTAP